MTEERLMRKRELEDKEYSGIIAESEAVELAEIRSTTYAGSVFRDLTDDYTIDEIAILFD